MEMSPFTNNGTSATAFGWGSDRERFGYYTSMPQQNTRNVTLNDWNGPSNSRQESYTVPGFPTNASPWSDHNFSNLSYSVRGDAWLNDQPFDARLGSSFGMPGSSAAGSEMEYFGGMQAAAPFVEQAIPVPPRAPPTYQPCSPGRTQAPSPPWQSVPSLYYPVHVGRHGEHTSPITSLETGHELPPVQKATSSSAAARRSETNFSQRGPQPITLLNSVQFSDPIDHAHVSPSTSRSRGERWESPNATMFQCMWVNHGAPCAAWIAGDRRSVTSHLRDEHNFTCDGQAMACAWAGCMTWMQRRNIPRHIVACHFAVKVTCSECGMALSRPDAKNKHRLACSGVKRSASRESTVDVGGCF